MKSLSYLNKYFIKYKWRFLLGILFIIGTNFFKVEMIEYFGDTIDALTTWGEDNKEKDVLLVALKTGGIFMLLSFCAGLILFLQRQAIIIMSRLIEFDLKNEVYQQYQQLTFTFFKQNSTGDLINRISEDVNKVRMYLGPGVMYTINLAILSIFVIYHMTKISPYLTLIVLIPLPLMSLIIYLVANRINKISTVVQKEQSYMSTLVQETFSGIRVAKAYSREKEINEKFARSAEAYKDKNMRLVLVNALFMPTIFALIGISTILCIYLGGLLHFDNAINQGDIIKFIFYVNILTWPFASVGWVISLIQRAAASQERINEFLEIIPEIKNISDAPFELSHKIEFKNVSYTYANSGIMAVKNLSFVINKGETLGITGRTGSGKSTIISLLLRQIEPDSGEILIDGVNLREINLEGLRQVTGIVPQDVFLFSDTIRNNILFGSPTADATEDQLKHVTKTAHVYHDITGFDQGFDTLLGERGVNLSGGQKQRVSIARALIRNPEILILDDCLSAVDTQTEETILNNFKEM
ncbi:MAG: ABC transporter ATP-binding protein, partial [Crocinitomicaceae bacterium]|nr:ABC transporter ATP-binding protein [Crocinitomicaceae bacterium]